MKNLIILLTFAIILLCCKGKSINFNAEQQKMFKEFVGHDFHTINLKSTEYLNQFKEQKKKEQDKAQKDQLNKFLENNQELKGLIDNINNNSGYDKVETSIPKPQIPILQEHEHPLEPNNSNALTIDEMIKGLNIKSAALNSFTSFVQKSDKAAKKKRIASNKKAVTQKKAEKISKTKKISSSKNAATKKSEFQRTKSVDSKSNKSVDGYV